MTGIGSVMYLGEGNGGHLATYVGIPCFLYATRVYHLSEREKNTLAKFLRGIK